MGSIIKWIEHHLLDPIKNLVLALAHAIAGVGNTILNFGVSIVHAWFDLRIGVSLVLRGIMQFLGSAEAAVWRLVFRVIPHAVAASAHFVQVWAGRLVSDAIHWVMKSVDYVFAWARRVTDFIWSELVTFKNWAVRLLTIAYNWVVHIGADIADLVLHPDKLAAWVVPHLLMPVVRFIIDRRFAIGRWFLRTAERVTLETATLVEEVIVKLF